MLTSTEAYLTRFYNGQNTQVKYHPYLAIILVDGKYNTQFPKHGSFVTRKFVLTTTGALSEYRPNSNLGVRPGFYVSGSKSDVVFEVQDVTMTKDSVGRIIYPNGLALLELKKEVGKKEAIPVNGLLDHDEELIPIKTVTLVGWEDCDGKSPPEHRLRKWFLPVVSWRQCKKIFRNDFNIRHKELACTPRLNTSSSMCEFFGAPLVDAKHRLVGLYVTYDQYTVAYVSTGYHREWIDSTIRAAESNKSDEGLGTVMVIIFVFAGILAVAVIVGALAYKKVSTRTPAPANNPARGAAAAAHA